MKKVFILTLLAAISMIASAQINQAIANRISGVYVFTDSDPIDEYDLLGEITCTAHTDYGSSAISTSIGSDGHISIGTITTTGSGGYMEVSSAQYTSVRDFLIQRAKIAYKDFDGIIIYPVFNGINRAIPIVFRNKSDNNKYALAKKINGLYIFTDSKPVSDYTTIDLTKLKNSFFPDYTYLRDRLIDKCSKKSIKASNGVIITLEDGGTDTAQFIYIK